MDECYRAGMIAIITFIDLLDDAVCLFGSEAAQVAREWILVELVADDKITSRLNPQFPSLLFVGGEFSMLYVVNDWSHPCVARVNVEQAIEANSSMQGDSRKLTRIVLFKLNLVEELRLANTSACVVDFLGTWITSHFSNSDWSSLTSSK